MIMRQKSFALLSTAVLLVTGAAGLSRANALTVATAPAGVLSAFAASDPVIKASCYRYGWRGWATYNTCEKHERKKPRESGR